MTGTKKKQISGKNGIFPPLLMINISLPLAPPPPEVSVTSPPETLAGSLLSLTCNVSVVELLVMEPSVEWLGSNGSPISSDGNPSVSSRMVVSGTLSTRVVEFSLLQTSHGGQYSCLAKLTIPNITPLNSTANTDVIIQSELTVSNYHIYP